MGTPTLPEITEHLPGALYDADVPVQPGELDALGETARPADADPHLVRPGHVAEAEQWAQVGLGNVAGAAPDLAHLHAPRSAHGEPGSDGTAIAARALEIEANPRTRTEPLGLQESRALTGSVDQDVRCPVAVKIPDCDASGHTRGPECRTGLRGYLGEATIPLIELELVRLLVRRGVIELRDVIEHVAIADVEVEPAVAVRVQERDPELQLQHTGCPDSAGIADLDKPLR